MGSVGNAAGRAITGFVGGVNSADHDASRDPSSVELVPTVPFGAGTTDDSNNVATTINESERK